MTLFLQSMSLSLNEDQEKIVRAKEALDAEREAMKGDTRTLANLRSEHARLKEDFRSLFTGIYLLTVVGHDLR